MNEYYAETEHMWSTPKSERSVRIYDSNEADARIAEAANRASEMEQRYDQATLRIAELERQLKVEQDEVSDLRGFIDGMKRHVTAAAAMFGLTS